MCFIPYFLILENEYHFILLTKVLIFIKKKNFKNSPFFFKTKKVRKYTNKNKKIKEIIKINFKNSCQLIINNILVFEKQQQHRCIEICYTEICFGFNEEKLSLESCWFSGASCYYILTNVKIQKWKKIKKKQKIEKDTEQVILSGNFCLLLLQIDLLFSKL